MFEQRTTRSNILGAFAAGLIVTAFCSILLWHNPLLFWNDDYQLSILPVFADIARSWNEGHLPLLSPYSWVCSNLAGEFQYGTFSIFVNAAVVLIWKFPLTFPQQAAALSITHLFVLAMGAFLLARGRTLSFPLSIFVALVATLNGWIVCWGATDWFGALGALAWLPWAWWALEGSLNLASQPALEDRAGASPASQEICPPIGSHPIRTHRKRLMVAALWPTPFVYLVIAGGFPYTVVMLALLISWLACRAVVSGGGGSIRSLVRAETLMSILPMAIGVALGIGLAAPAWLAIFDYVHGSAREVQPNSAHWQWIVPWRALPGFILPCWTVNWADFSTRMMPHVATELSSGLVAPLAIASTCLTGLAIRDSRIATRTLLWRIRWELGLLFAVLLLAMCPTTGMFRWSFRWLPFFHLVLAVCAAEALREDRQSRSLVALLLIGVTAVAMSIFGTTGVYAFPLTWILLGLAGVWAIAELFQRNSKWRDWTPVGISFAAFLATYLCIPPNGDVPRYNLSQELTSPAPLDPSRLYLSVYPPPEWSYRVEYKPQPIGQIVRPGSTSMWARLRFVNGYSPIRPAGVAREFNSAVHGEIDPDIAMTLLQDQSGALAELGIDGIVVAQEIFGDPPAPEWQLVFSNDEGRVFHRTGPPFKTVRSVGRIDSEPDKQFALATITHLNDFRNSVEVSVDVPPGDKSALLKFTRPFFPGYIARLGQEHFSVGSYRGLFPTVELPAGSHGHLVLSYRPLWLVCGGAVSIFCVIILVLMSSIAIRSRK